MDVLLSLPIASYFLAPSVTSWSTSLNLLFFYMTWSTLILSHKPLHIHLVGLLALRAVLWLVPSLLFLLFDSLLPSLAESLKLGGRSALPPRDPLVLGRTVLLALVNLVLLAAIEGGLSLGFVFFFREPQFKTSTTLPLPWQMIKHGVLLLAAREGLQYYIHRFVLHGDSRIAKWHTRFLHYRSGAPYSLMLFADHPVPLLLHRLVPLYLPAMLLRPHLLTYFLVVAMCTLEETFATSGYSIVPGIFMGGVTRRVAIHYASGGASNFGAWGIFDWVCGTSKGRDVLEDVRGEAEKHRLKERGEERLHEGTSLLQGGVDALRNGSDSGSTRRSGRKRASKKSE